MNNPQHSTSSAQPAQVSYIEILPAQAGQRIDNFLLTQLKGVPKSRIYKILRGGEVRVNKGRIKPTYRIQAGDIVRIPPLRLPTPEEAVAPSSAVLSQLRDSIIYEDKGLLIINKPSGIAVHGGSGLSYGVIEGLRALFPNEPYLELAHRLDRETSGCLVLVKKSSVLRQLHADMQAGKVRKTYLALLRGQWEPRLADVTLPLRKNQLSSGERIVKVDHSQGKPAHTRFALQRGFADAFLARVELLTGRTHQIRVHAAHSGHPLAGDDKYGDDEFNRTLRTHGLKRLFLHAASLEIPRPDAAPLRIEAPLPTTLEQVLDKLPKR